MPTKRTALITGASSGIGAALAKTFAAHGYNIVVVARRADRLEALAEDIGTEFQVEVTAIPMDLARNDACPKIAAELYDRNVTVDALVNNAGYALTGGFLESSCDEHKAMLQVMLTGYTELTHVLLPGMIERGFGRIINVSSLAAFAPPTKGSLYSAIKSYVKDFSAAIDFEYREQGVQCTALCPGFTYTEFHDVMGMREQASQFPQLFWQSADEVADEGYNAVMAGRVVAVTGLFNRFLAALLGVIPRPLMLHFGRTAERWKTDEPINPSN